MKEFVIYALCVLCFFLGLYIGWQQPNQETEQLQEKLATKQLQLDLTVASHKECRVVLRQVLETFDYIQPRPITNEN